MDILIYRWLLLSITITMKEGRGILRNIKKINTKMLSRTTCVSLY